jgi:hypothetical protein
MATFTSNVAATNVPAKSGVRDTIRVPFTVSGSGAGSGDEIVLAKVSQGHRLVGYYVEAKNRIDSSGTAALLKLVYKVGSSAAVDVVTASTFGIANGTALSQYGSRNSAGAVPGTPGTWAAGVIPTDVFASDGTVSLVLTAAPGTAAAFTIVGFIEVQPD